MLATIVPLTQRQGFLSALYLASETIDFRTYRYVAFLVEADIGCDKTYPLSTFFVENERQCLNSVCLAATDVDLHWQG